MGFGEIRFLLTKFCCLICVVCICHFPNNGHCNSDGGDGGDYFSAIAGMEVLFHTESQLVINLQNYLDEISVHIDALKSELKSIRSEHSMARVDLESYLSSPVNSYRLIKRLQSDWTTFEETIRDDVSAKNFLTAMAINRQSLHFPKSDDVYNAALALVRLQDTYQLDVPQLASGILNGVKIGSAMSWQDCFVLGHQLYELRDFNHTVPWLKHSMQVLASQAYHDDPISLDFMATVASYHQEMGDLETALDLVKYILNKDPQRETMWENKAHLEEMIATGIKKGLMHEPSQQSDYHQSNEFKLYEKICRGEVNISPAQQRQLRCRLFSNDVGFYVLQPFKMEELFLDPFIVQFHDVIRVDQMDILKQLAAPKMARSKVHALNGSEEIVATYRTSKTAWFPYETHPLMEQMRLNVAHISGLDMPTTEELQVANYGIGGHYEPHWDFFLDANCYDERDGNRIATAIYYISDVEEGGGTAFLYLPLLVKPERGSLVFWYNLHHSEEPDYRTKHGACPVLRGSKWIANVWTRVRGQEFRRPCRLQPDHEASSIYKENLN